MSLSHDLISQFVKITNDDKNKQQSKKDTTVYGTVVVADDKEYVKLDGSELLTPVDKTTRISDGERVTVMIKDHKAIVTGNMTAPAARGEDIDKAVDQITEFEILIGKELDVEKARIDELVVDNITINGKLTAVDGYIENLEAEDLRVNGKLEANEAEIKDLKVKKLDVETADIKFATIENLNATNVEVQTITGNFADFAVTTTDKLTANDADIKKLNADKLSATEADLKYANIDFANIGTAAIENLFAESGLIKDLIVGDGTITGELVGVTIKGDLIEGNTIIAEKLVIRGSDGLYYKLNTDGMTTEAEQTDKNSLNGSIITAKSITATKVAVDDLVAFDATIGGFKITKNSIYSGTKASVDNTTKGIYLDNTGQIAFGDANNFLKFFKDADGSWKLAISASQIKLSSSNQNIEDMLDDMHDKVQKTVKLVETHYAMNDSATVVPTTGWSKIPPVWTNGKYIWSKTITTYTDASVIETSPVCITGAKGEAGVSGKGIKTITNYYLATNLSTGVITSTPGWTTTMQTMTVTNKYLWNYEAITYTDNSTSNTIPVIMGVYGDKGIDGSAGKGIKTITEKYAVSNSNTVPPTTWFDTVQTMTASNKYLWNYEIITYTDNTTSETAKRVTGVYGDKGDKGADGVGISAVDVEYYLSTSSTALAGGSWVTTAPTWVDGKFMWTRTKTVTTSGQTTYSNPVCVTGGKGPSGSDGKGIKTTVVTYQASANGTTVPTGAWVTTIPTVAPGQYLWTRTVITYTDDTTATSYSIGKMGEQGPAGSNGATGAPGKGVKTTDITYQASSSGTTTPTGAWSTAIPTVAPGQYLWTRTIITYTDNTTATAYSIGKMGEQGPSGPNGATGQGVDSIIEEYYLSTSKTAQAGGSWVTTPPTWSIGKYMWTRSKITYKNPVATAYTTPVCDTAWEAVNDLDIGGRNLLRDAGVTVTNNIYNIKNYNITEAIPNDATVTISIKGILGSDRVSWGVFNSGGMVHLENLYPYNRNSRGIYTKTFKWIVGGSLNKTLHLYQYNSSGTSNSTIEWVKLEYGSKNTDYSDAPEDIVATYATKTNLTVMEEKINASVTETFKGYASKVDLDVSGKQILAKFSMTGGFNLIRNSTGMNVPSSGWVSTAPMGISTNVNIGGPSSYMMYLDNEKVTTERYAMSTRFKLKPNTKYTLSGWFHCYSTCPTFDVNVLASNTLIETDPSKAYTTVYPLLANDHTKGAWVKRTASFTTAGNIKSGFVRIDNNGYNAAGTITEPNRIHWSALMLNEGEEQPWTPHQSEIYDGYTMIDALGVTIKNGAIKLLNNKGEEVLKGDSNGNLILKNQLTVGGTQKGGTIEVLNPSNAQVVNINSAGVAVKSGAVVVTGDVIPGDIYAGMEPYDTYQTMKLYHDSMVLQWSNVKNQYRLSYGTRGFTSTGFENAVGGWNCSVASDYANGNMLTLKDHQEIFADAPRGFTVQRGNITIGPGGGAGSRPTDWRSLDIYRTSGGAERRGRYGMGVASGETYANPAIELHDAAGITMGRLDIVPNSIRFSSKTADKSAYMAVYVGNTRQGYFGKGSSSSRVLYLLSDVGEVVIRSKYSTGVALDDGGYFRPEKTNGLALGTTNHRWSTVYYTALNAASDSRLKENIKYMDEDTVELLPSFRSVEEPNNSINNKDCYDFVKQHLRLAQYDYKQFSSNEETSENNCNKIGFIADDIKDTKVGRIFIRENSTDRPEIEYGDDDSVGNMTDEKISDITDTVLSYDLTDYTNVLAGALKTAVNKIETLETTVSELTQKNIDLEARLKVIEDLIINKNGGM